VSFHNDSGSGADFSPVDEAALKQTGDIGWTCIGTLVRLSWWAPR
jgi:hypothetical protein